MTQPQRGASAPFCIAEAPMQKGASQCLLALADSQAQWQIDLRDTRIDGCSQTSPRDVAESVSPLRATSRDSTTKARIVHTLGPLTP
ncbi:hypothetical protein Mpe_A0064 [Methylibium petroleiphilum PM1]|uniref:Uncharacterized protein n=1 Tax=Methylibium petroleiphilum (strain ATCC BAA-1232 / LMG 22953 / PM1) TaxID=420662 RepID=A2SBT7_METPP|nr:hypothetical protein Mpe_A0064 [Methylibium petroleiphilum PM1]